MNFLSFNVRGLGGEEKQGWVRSLRAKNGINFLALGESKKSSVTIGDISGFWGSGIFDFASVDSVGFSGGLVCLWDNSMFKQTSVSKNWNFLLIRGSIVGSGVVLNVLNVYAPQSVHAKKLLWDELAWVIAETDGFWVVTGDFNVVRHREEKRNCAFKQACANNFNSFIYEAGLVEYNMSGRKFTCSSNNGRKLSKLDRFLVCSGFFNVWPEASVVALSCYFSDQCPIILKSVAANFGARPFRIFDSWFGKQGFDDVVVSTLSGPSCPHGLHDLALSKKLGVLRVKLKEWRDNMLKESSEEVAVAMTDLENIESVMEERDLTEEKEWILLESKKILKDEEARKIKDFKQRSRIRWAKEGDENSKFFHTMINCRKASNIIQGLNVDGVWVTKLRRFSNILSDFYDSGKINLGCGSSFIALIHKVKDPQGLKDYWPISLVGVIDKVISTILASRLKTVLDSIVSTSQSAFVCGRYILDGPLIINEIQNWSKRVNKKVFMLMTDFEKAYDNVHWNFVVDILAQMGFSYRWCLWIKGILESARVFVIVMEALSHMIERACASGLLKGVSLPNDGPTVSHLLYADDAIIMGDWSRDNILNVVRILRCFHSCSSLQNKFTKSNLFGRGLIKGEVEDMAVLVGCKAATLPFKYLGLTVRVNMNCISNCRPVFDIFEKRLALWKAFFLSIGWRVTLIQSVLESLPSYFLSLYQAPIKVLADLEAMIRRFLWGGSSDVKKLHWVAWDRVTSPKQENLWVKVIEALHVGGSKWDFFPAKKANGGVWCNIVSVLNKPVADNAAIRNLFKGVVGRGDSIIFWLDPWLFDVPLKDMFPSLFHLEVVKNCCVRDRILGEGLWLWRHVPNSEVEVAEWRDLVLALSSVTLSDSLDRWRWVGSGSEGFSVAAVKKFIEAKSDYNNRFVMDWCKWVLLKCNILAWRAEMDRIPTVEALVARGVVVDGEECSFCGSGPDSVLHIFTACPVALGVWEKISFWCRIMNFFVFSFRDLLAVHSFGDRGPLERKALQGIVISACWCLWKARNCLRFNGKRSSVDDIFSEVRTVSFFWFKHREKKGLLDWGDWCKFVNM
ncbi:uncharacterized protein LOC110898836 [Helianthus annuus]|uniref:uncharacterized protein LOC110898836 n=1 Tax=Helianthus annuus TaxID=4232 RepID=UPI000B8F219B|nr:uncharacterized protein LOC110898836 [Helianthus annuus]